MKFLALCLLIFNAPLLAQNQLSTKPINNYHTGVSLLPACAKSEIFRLETATTGLAHGRNPAGAWMVARAMLCGKRAPIGNMPKLVAKEQYGVTDDPGPTFLLVSRDTINSLNGQAYGVTVTADRSEIRFNYNTAGICVGGFTLRPFLAEWLLVSTGEACD